MSSQFMKTDNRSAENSNVTASQKVVETHLLNSVKKRFSNDLIVRISLFHEAANVLSVNLFL